MADIAASASAADPSDQVFHHRLVVAYHGTNREIGEAILLGRQELQAKAKTWHWLGQGIYFWEHGIARAREWARANYPDSPFVLGAYINLGRCLDLTDTWATTLLKSAYDALRATQDQQAKPMPANASGRGAAPRDRLLRQLDCAVIDTANTPWLMRQPQRTMERRGRSRRSEASSRRGPRRFPAPASVRRRTSRSQCAIWTVSLGYFRPR